MNLQYLTLGIASFAAAGVLTILVVLALVGRHIDKGQRK